MRKKGERLFSPEAAADLIFWGGNVITVDPRKPAAQAVAIKNGRFLMAGRMRRSGRLPGGTPKSSTSKGGR